MDGARFMEKDGKEIFVLTFSSSDIDHVLAQIDECARQVRQRPPKSVLTMTVVDGPKFNTQFVEALKHLTKGNEPHVKRAAAVGVTGLYKVAINAISLFSKREFKLFDCENEAVAYLTAD